ncbi:MAG: TIGR03560 family F420-dependent LLM class oxidoreductase [Actinobacteria bacterium]|nr:TIGR03560 family F420-dependent LLM class oxidoreductase [Actinomycetota bacterium]
MDVCLMIEGQEDVTWEDWTALARACERAGLGTMFRSDHYLTVVEGSGRGALDAWATISALAATTERLRLGTLVSPATFRHPSVLAKMVTTADHVSGGRVELGIGAGWWVAEHEAYGFPLDPIGARMDALEEQCEILVRHWEGGRFSFAGERYRSLEVEPLPRPVQEHGPPLILGAGGRPRSIRLAARLADEYNVPELTAAELAAVRQRLDQACEAIGRDPATLPLSVMTGWVVGADEADLDRRLGRLAAWEGAESAAAYRAALPPGWIVGTVEQAHERVAALAAAGVARVMAQHLLHRDLDAVELLGREFSGPFTAGRRPPLSPP